MSYDERQKEVMQKYIQYYLDNFKTDQASPQQVAWSAQDSDHLKGELIAMVIKAGVPYRSYYWGLVIG